jgi:hypothetical protein
MKVNIEIDMTPEEARRFMGLPDVSAMNEQLVAQMGKQMKSAMEDPETAMKTWMSLSGQGMEQFQRFLWDSARRATGGKKSAGKETS